MSDILDRLESIFESEGARAYLGETVTTAGHMKQAAMRAKKSGAAEPLIAAALLHDVGYFSDAAMSAEAKDREHDRAGALFLSKYFGPDVTEPIRLHVQAKRYLCAVEPDYRDKLSQASERTLGLQGGPMSEREVIEFEANPHHRAAVQLRRYDDEGKQKGVSLPAFSSFRPLLERLLIDRAPRSEPFDVRAHWDKYWGNATPFHRDVLHLELLDWDLEEGSVTMRLPYSESFDNSPNAQQAVIHGGVLASFVDATTGFALAMAARHPGGPTVDLRLDCLAPAVRTALIGKARVIKCGRKIGVADVSITNEKGKLVAIGRQTCYMGQ